MSRFLSQKAGICSIILKAGIFSKSCGAPAPALWPVSTGSGTTAPDARRCAVRSGRCPPPSQTSSRCGADRTGTPSVPPPIPGGSAHVPNPAGCGLKDTFAVLLGRHHAASSSLYAENFTLWFSVYAGRVQRMTVDVSRTTRKASDKIRSSH